MATSVEWRGLTLGAATGHKIEKVEGWESLPPSRYDKRARTGGHGSHPSRVWSDERLVTVTGESHSAEARDQLLRVLQRSMTFGEDEEPLSITLAGRTLTAGAQLLRCDPVVAHGSWNYGQIKWVAQWRCPDPLRYGPTQTLSTGLPTDGGGLQYPLYQNGHLDYGQPGTTGRLTLTNPGTAPAPILFGVRGGLPEGYEISADRQRLRYPVVVPAGQVIALDTAAGTVLVEGTASRRGNLTVADWMQVPACDPMTGAPGQLVVQFTSLGGAYDPDARLTASWAEANW